MEKRETFRYISPVQLGWTIIGLPLLIALLLFHVAPLILGIIMLIWSIGTIGVGIKILIGISRRRADERTRS